jgi:hypothetical protein
MADIADRVWAMVNEKEEQKARERVELLRREGFPEAAEEVGTYRRAVSDKREELRGRIAARRTVQSGTAPIRRRPRQSRPAPVRRRGSRRCGSRRRATASASRDGPSDLGDDSDPSGPADSRGALTRRRGRQRSERAPELLRDVADYVRRVGPQGAERAWLVEQVAALGHQAEQVSVALSLLAHFGSACTGHAEDTPVVWRARR